METLIKTKISINKLEKLFDRTDLVYIKHYKLANNGHELPEDVNLDEEINFFISIRHNENEDPLKIFKKAEEKIN